MLTVFTGPSLAPAQVRAMLPHAEVRPPVARGDLHTARHGGADLLLVIDGTFSHNLAVSPREVVDVLDDGAVVLGASSMGAIRAADCHPAGMRGIGAVYRWYRAGLLSSDDAVAVATDPDRDYAAVSVALANVHAAVRRARGRGLLDRPAAAAIEAAAADLFFAHRGWRAILQGAGVPDPDGAIRAFCEKVDVKRSDAVMAVREAGRTAGGKPVDAQSPPAFARPIRYAGHDPLLGYGDEAASLLVRWLFGSGRYQRYLWPLVLDEPEFGGLGDEPDRPAALRERLAVVLARVLQEPAELASRLKAELDFLEELDSELMRWHAARVVSQQRLDRGERAPAHATVAAREAVAIAHGYPDWRSLAGDVVDGRVFGAIPLSWVEDACTRLALCRSRPR